MDGLDIEIQLFETHIPASKVPSAGMSFGSKITLHGVFITVWNFVTHTCLSMGLFTQVTGLNQMLPCLFVY